MIRAAPLTIGIVVLAILWLGPLPQLMPASFSSHMALHMGVVAIAAPFIGIGLAGGRPRAAQGAAALLSPVAASVIELLVVWAWHAPALHHAARQRLDALIAEQAMFLFAGVWLWVAACGGARAGGARAWAGVAGLWFTSIHMTLLGAIFAVAPRALYAHVDPTSAAALADQHLGGGLMLIVGGASYLVGGLWLAFHGLKGGVTAPRSSSPDAVMQ